VAEVIKSILLVFAANGTALIIAGCVLFSLAWLLREERPDWLRFITFLCLLALFVVVPAVLLVQAWTSPDNTNQPYDDRPYSGSDRYR
jgi:heme/copper-type cytochrome/quinol oxidase subunit 2